MSPEEFAHGRAARRRSSGGTSAFAASRTRASPFVEALKHVAGVSRGDRHHVPEPDRSGQHALRQRRQPAAARDAVARLQPGHGPHRRPRRGAAVAHAAADPAAAPARLVVRRFSIARWWRFGATDLDAAVLEKLATARDLADSTRSAASSSCWCCGRRSTPGARTISSIGSSRRAP